MAKQNLAKPYIDFGNGIKFPDPVVHDTQHWWASVIGLVTGVTVFVTYYYITRAEDTEQKVFKRDMPWYYFVIAPLLFACLFSALACLGSTALRRR